MPEFTNKTDFPHLESPDVKMPSRSLGVIPSDGREKDSNKIPERKDLTYFHVDDQDDLREKTRTDLASEIEVTIKLGEAPSVEEGIRNLEILAKQGQAPHVIVLDQSFLLFANEDIPDRGAAETFIKGFVKLTERYPILKSTVIVMYSGTADEDYLQEMQGICPQVIGLAEKGQFALPVQMAAILGDAGRVQVDPVITAAQEEMRQRKIDVVRRMLQ